MSILASCSHSSFRRQVEKNYIRDIFCKEIGVQGEAVKLPGHLIYTCVITVFLRDV